MNEPKNVRARKYETSDKYKINTRDESDRYLICAVIIKHYLHTYLYTQYIFMMTLFMFGFDRRASIF